MILYSEFQMKCMSDNARYTCDFKPKCSSVQNNSKLQMAHAVITTWVSNDELQPGSVLGKGRVDTDREAPL